MKIKVNEASGVVLNWMVAKCEGLINDRNELTYDADLLYDIKTKECMELRFKPSKDWAQGGPIIEREQITLQNPRGVGWQAEKWVDNRLPTTGHHALGGGNTALLAAMRCYVASKLGYEVEVPDEIKP